MEFFKGFGRKKSEEVVSPIPKEQPVAPSEISPSSEAPLPSAEAQATADEERAAAIAAKLTGKDLPVSLEKAPVAQVEPLDINLDVIEKDAQREKRAQFDRAWTAHQELLQTVRVFRDLAASLGSEPVLENKLNSPEASQAFESACQVLKSFSHYNEYSRDGIYQALVALARRGQLEKMADTYQKKVETDKKILKALKDQQAAPGTLTATQVGTITQNLLRGEDGIKKE